MTISRRLAVFAVLPCAGLSVTGCTKTIKEKDLESKITDSLQGQLKGTRINVDCPGGKDAKKGNTFSCKALIGGRPATVDVHLEDDSGKFSFRVRSGTK